MLQKVQVKSHGKRFISIFRRVFILLSSVQSRNKFSKNFYIGYPNSYVIIHRIRGWGGTDSTLRNEKRL